VKGTETILQITNLSTAFDTEAGRITVLDDVSFDIKKGKTVGIVGESGCGKSVTSLSVMRLLPRPAGHITSGTILYKDQDLLELPITKMHKIRGRKIAMIFQEPMTALNPVQNIGLQLGETYRLHFPKMKDEEIEVHSLQMLESVGIPDAKRRLSEYPHQLSGGIRQRVMIAMALACRPDLLIADEPTTALDVTIQAQILQLIKKMQQDMGMAVMFITHDLGVIAEIFDEVVVMYAGHVVEKGTVHEIFSCPKHPYTKGLLSSIPRITNERKTKLSVIDGMVPDLYNLPAGCRFDNRCPLAESKCRMSVPDLVEVSANHYSKCWKHKEL